MTPVLMVWLIISMVGLIVLPAVLLRRFMEWRYWRVDRGDVRKLLLLSRMSRTALLSLAVIFCASVALIVWKIPPTEARSTMTIVLLVGVEVALVATLWSDEVWARKIDHCGADGG